MRTLFFAHVVLCALSASAHAPWRWQLIPAGAHLILDGRERAPGSWSARLHTEPESAGSFELQLTSTSSAEAPFIRWSAPVDDQAFCEAELMRNGVAFPLLLNVVVVRSSDVNGQQLLHLSIAEAPFPQEEPTVSGPRSGPVTQASTFALDAWFMLADPAPPFVRFCNADD